MERLLLTLIVLVILGTGAALAELRGLEAYAPRIPLSVEELPDSGWRRTALGWEHESAWALPLRTEPAPLQQISPLVIGTLQLLTAIGALVLFHQPTPQRNDA